MEKRGTLYFQKFWRKFCRFMVSVFYRQVEYSGLEHLPAKGPLVICANHVNALVDAVVVQAFNERTVHPIARSGLFNQPLLKIVLSLVQAVPVYRAQDNDGKPLDNLDMFAACYERLQAGGCLLIFPEGQSHSDPRLREFKTGAARLVLGAREQGIQVQLLPVGLNFSAKGKFRSRVLVKIDPPLSLHEFSNKPEDVRELTARLQRQLEEVTLNVDSVQDIMFLESLERFFAVRHGKYRRRSLDVRLRALKKLANAQKKLRKSHPSLVENVRRQLHQFERTCRHWGIRDYHLNFDYHPTLVTRFIVRSVLVLTLVLPMAAWGYLNSSAPYILTRWSSLWVSKGKDQYDTAKMAFGLFFFWSFWLLQTLLVYYYLELGVALSYAASLPASAAVALYFRKEKQRIWENLRVFFLFVRKRKLKQYLLHKRQVLERELAHLVRLAKQ